VDLEAREKEGGKVFPATENNYSHFCSFCRHRSNLCTGPEPQQYTPTRRIWFIRVSTEHARISITIGIIVDISARPLLTSGKVKGKEKGQKT